MKRWVQRLNNEMQKYQRIDSQNFRKGDKK